MAGVPCGGGRVRDGCFDAGSSKGVFCLFFFARKASRQLRWCLANQAKLPTRQVYEQTTMIMVVEDGGNDNDIPKSTHGPR